MSYDARVRGGEINTKAPDKVAKILRKIGVDCDQDTPDLVEILSGDIKYDESDFEELAAYAEDNSYILFVGEDDTVWTLDFKDGRMIDKTGEILWDHTEKVINRMELPEFIGQIIDIFEDFLEEKGVALENPEKQEAVDDGTDPDSIAIIYGTDYGALQDDLETMLRNWELIKEA